MNQIGFYPKLAMVILLAIGLAEIYPELVNAVLFLVLVGLLLGHWSDFSGLAKLLGSIK
jgi:hypothetical protein